MAGRRVIRHLVLDNEAATALLSTAHKSPKRAAVLIGVTAATGRCVAPTAVRVEVGWDRRASPAANANRLVRHDDPLDTAGANRAAELRRAVTSASVVDAAVAVAAERVGGGTGIVEILTSDVSDITALSSQLAVTVIIKPI